MIGSFPLTRGHKKTRLAAGFFNCHPLARVGHLSSSVEDEELTHIENTKAPAEAQQLQTTAQSFANIGHGDLLAVRPGVPASEALGMARNLANGLQHLCEHLGDVVNCGGDVSYLDELRTLSFLGETMSALIFSVEHSFELKGGEA